MRSPGRPAIKNILHQSYSGLCFQHLPRDLANVNAWKTTFDPYIEGISDYAEGN